MFLKEGEVPSLWTIKTDEPLKLSKLNLREADGYIIGNLEAPFSSKSLIELCKFISPTCLVMKLNWFGSKPHYLYIVTSILLSSIDICWPPFS